MPSPRRRRSPSVPSCAHSIRPTPSRPTSSASSTVRHVGGGGVAEGGRLGQHRRLDVVEQVGDPVLDPLQRHLALLAAVAAEQGHLALGEVARAEVDPQRHPFQLPVDGASAEAGVDVGVDLDPDAGGGDRVAELARLLSRPVLVADDDDRHLGRRDPRRQPQPARVAVSHDQAADQPGRGAPGGGPGGLRPHPPSSV